MRREKVVPIESNMGDHKSYIEDLILLYTAKYVKNDSNQTKLSKKNKNHPMNKQIQMFFKMAYPLNS